MLVALLYSINKGYETSSKANVKEIGKDFLDSLLALFMPVLILGGIYGGFFTPTEASVVAVVYGFIIGIFVYKKITFSVLKEILHSTVVVVSSLSMIIASASFFGLWLTMERIPHELGTFITNSNLSPFFVMALIIILLLAVGTFMDEISAIIILTPILLPVVTAIGFDPVHFGVIMVINLAIGLLTPPVGLSLFVAAKVGNVNHEALIKPVLPFIFILIVDVILLVLLPQISVGISLLAK
jgi:C4-dicarboxylate transporter DctM subunit